LSRYNSGSSHISQVVVVRHRFAIRAVCRQIWVRYGSSIPRGLDDWRRTPWLLWPDSDTRDITVRNIKIDNTCRTKKSYYAIRPQSSFFGNRVGSCHVRYCDTRQIRLTSGSSQPRLGYTNEFLTSASLVYLPPRRRRSSHSPRIIQLSSDRSTGCSSDDDLNPTLTRLSTILSTTSPIIFLSDVS